ncbi:MAG: Bax inhibitor-1/YccA family protein [Actinomycetota bacterium]|nr:Bax inhibitor-1/YccA family protein [Actinomycetota bacterium]
MAMQTIDRSPRMERAFDRMTDAYPVLPLQPGAMTFTAAGVYDKLGLLVVLAMVTGAISYFTNSSGLMILGFVAGFVLSLVGIFRPATAKIVAPLYALAEGLALGGITAYFATGNSGIVPLAIIFTSGIFLGALVIFRSGLVKVTPKFVSLTIMASVGFLLVLLGLMFGLPVPGLSGASGLVIVGVIGVAIGILHLFIDFNYVQIGEQRRLPVDGEWYGALILMISLVFIYINVLRILGRRR